MKIDEVFPSQIEVKYDCLKIDGCCISVITVTSFETSINILKTVSSLIGDKEIEISFHIHRENNMDILKKLTNIIAESSSEIKSISKNQIDVNLLDNIKNKAHQLRKKIQIDNEQIYKLNTYILIKAGTTQKLINKQKRYINKLFSNQIIAKPCNFRQKDAYLATLPVVSNNQVLSKYTYNIFTERGLAKFFPFFQSDVFDKNGILLGKANNNLCAIDMFSNKNNNYNMCVFGSSGAGKSYFVKLMILRNAYKGIKQIIVDPEGEYGELIKNLGGRIISLDCYNPFEIEESLLNEEDFFNIKVNHIVQYVNTFIKNMDFQKVKDCVIKAYNKYGINEKKTSLYRDYDDTKMYFKSVYTQKFPTITDLNNIMKQEGLNYKIEKTKHCPCNKDTNNSSNTQLYLFNLKGKDIKQISISMKIFMPKIYELIQEETLIYFDEIWKCIGLGEDRYVIEQIYNMFKTLRKKKAGIVAISQDIYDLFVLDKGEFGKSILNNANMKALFKMEWDEIEIFEKILGKSEIANKIKLLQRGNTYISINNTSFNLEVKATEHEHKIISGGNYEENIGGNR